MSEKNALALSIGVPGNPVLVVAVAMVLGGLFGVASERLAALINRPAQAGPSGQEST